MFSLSEFRDLLFHVQEHLFTIPQIKKCLAELDLKFCGFTNPKAVSLFLKENSSSSSIKIHNLDEWEIFEKKNPQVFSEMYQFVCQKI